MVIPVLQLLIQKIFPVQISNAILRKIHETRLIVDRYRGKMVFRVLKIILFIVFFPVLLVCNLVTFLFKTILVWLLPELQLRRLKTAKGDVEYSLNEYRLDKQARGFTVEEAYDRAKYLLFEFYGKGRERTVCFGEKNPDKTFLVIRPHYYSTNRWAYARVHLMNQYYIALQNLDDAEKHGWIPIVDWENYEVPHKEKSAIHGSKNAWEYYFEQPSQYSLEEVYQSKHVILSYQNFLWYEGMTIPHPLNYSDPSLFAKQLVEIASEYAKKVPFNQPTLQHLREAKKKLFPQKGKILGVAYRSSITSLAKKDKEFAKMSKGYADRKAPDIDVLVKIVKRRMRDWKADYIFFTNEEEEFVQYMKEVFRDKVLIYPRTRYKEIHRYSDSLDSLSDYDPLYLPGKRYRTNLDYLTEMYLLSQCDMLICSLLGGTKAAIMWNEGRYEQLEIIDLGTYRI